MTTWLEGVLRVAAAVAALVPSPSVGHHPEPDAACVRPGAGSFGGVTPRGPSPVPVFQSFGEASYYHPDLHGHRTASGGLYRRQGLTAAHRTLPFGTTLRVTNLENGRQVVVVVTDRGPFVPGRVVDLSEAAARRLGMLRRGVVRVRLERMEPRGGPGGAISEDDRRPP